MNVGTGWNSFWDNNNVGQCPITACTLKNGATVPSCSFAYTGTHLSIGPDPFHIIAQKNVINGYSDNICLSCTISHAYDAGTTTLNFDNF